MLVHVGLDWNVTSAPWAKFEVAKPMDESRNQVVNPNASPGASAMNPVGLGLGLPGISDPSCDLAGRGIVGGGGKSEGRGSGKGPRSGPLIVVGGGCRGSHGWAQGGPQRGPYRRTRTDSVPSGVQEGGRGTSALPFALVTAIVTPFRFSGIRSIAIRKPRSCPYDISLEVVAEE